MGVHNTARKNKTLTGYVNLIYFVLLGAVCISFGDTENIICTIPTHTATGSFKRRSDTHTAPTEAVCGGRIGIELRPELYAYLQRISAIYVLKLTVSLDS